MNLYAKARREDPFRAAETVARTVNLPDTAVLILYKPEEPTRSDATPQTVDVVPAAP